MEDMAARTSSVRLVSDAVRIFRAGVTAVQPAALLRRNVQYHRDTDTLHVCGDAVRLDERRLHVAGAGKAVGGMAVELCHLLGDRIQAGVVIVPRGATAALPDTGGKLVYCEGATHNLPDVDAARATQEIIDLATGLTTQDILLVVLSGGGSALLTLPPPNVSIDEKSDLVRRLARAGADITELNSVRKKLSGVKGGRLAALANPAQVLTLVLSDIVGDPLDLIASGPTVRDTDAPARATDILRKYRLIDSLPDSIRTALQHEVAVSFPEQSVRNYIVGSNKLSVAAAAETARGLGYAAVEVTSHLTGDVRSVARQYLALTTCLADLHRQCVSVQGALDTLNELDITRDSEELRINLSAVMESRKVCLVFGGETTVEVRGDGRGGRSQQLALEVSVLLEGWEAEERGVAVQLLSGGTDGADGPTPAAGAIATCTLARSARLAGLSPELYRDNNDAFTFYSLLNDGEFLLTTGHTGTNVMDVHLLMLDFSQK